MNQILITRENNYIYENFISKKTKEKKNYLFVFFLSFSFCIILLFYLLFSNLKIFHNNKETELIKDKYNVTTLYSSNNNYESIKLSNQISIIGLIEIPSINISYPVLSNSNEELLKISVCRFSGPLPNRVGNLCIVGHNYKNSLMFSNLRKLDKNDVIYITDLNNVRLEYIVYDKFTVKENNLECTKNTSNTEVTLITCNDIDNSKRIIIKAKVKS